MAVITEESARKIREAVKVLSKLSDEEWKQIIYLSERFHEEDVVDNEKKIIYNYLQLLGTPIGLKGYKYLVYALECVLEKAEEYDAITKALYPEIARKFNTTPQRVEKAIRHAIERTYAVGDMEEIEKIFPKKFYREKRRPTNSEFIFGLAEYIKFQTNM